jgi:hypothetical protein
MKFKHLIIGLAVVGFSVDSNLCRTDVKAMTLISERKEVSVVKDSLKVVKTYIDSIDKKRWNELLKLIPEDRKEFWAEFLSNKENEKNNLGVLNVTSAKIKEIKLIPEDGMKKIMSLEKYKLNYSNIESYLVGIDYRVKSENTHYFNGIRYEIFIVGWNNKNPYVLADLDAPLENIVPNGLGFNSPDEKKALKIIKEKYKGRYLNNKGELLEENKGLKVKPLEITGDGNSNTNE